MLMMQFDPSLADALDIAKLERGMPGITPRIGAYLAEAAVTCLEDETHRSGVAMLIDGDCDHRLRIRWIAEGNRDQRVRAWNDPDEATEQGACGIAVLLVETLTEYTVVERARKGPGFDYWLGKKDSVVPLFQDKARLEVSGLRRGDNRAVDSRLRRKDKQIEVSNSSGLPGLVAVVEFGSPRTRVRTK
jgi:hypothetical protein